MHFCVGYNLGSGAKYSWGTYITVVEGTCVRRTESLSRRFAMSDRRSLGGSVRARTHKAKDRRVLGRERP